MDVGLVFACRRGPVYISLLRVGSTRLKVMLSTKRPPTLCTEMYSYKLIAPLYHLPAIVRLTERSMCMNVSVSTLSVVDEELQRIRLSPSEWLTRFREPLVSNRHSPITDPQIPFETVCTRGGEDRRAAPWLTDAEEPCRFRMPY